MSKAKPADNRGYPSPKIEAIAPFPDAALSLLWQWIEAARSQVADDSSPQTPDEFIALERARAEDVCTFAIYRDHELGGYVRVVPLTAWSCEAHCVFKREFYGYQTTLPALDEVARQVFEAGVTRITMLVYQTNTAIRALLKRLGAFEEGRMRECARQNGQPVDMLVYGLLKQEWETAFAVRNNQPAPKLDES